MNEQTGLDEKFITVGQVAKWLNISAPNVYRLTKAKLLPHHNFGKKTIRVSVKDLTNFVKKYRISLD